MRVNIQVGWGILGGSKCTCRLESMMEGKWTGRLKHD